MSGIIDRLAAVRQSIVEAECYAQKTPAAAIERIRESIEELAAIQDELAGGDADPPTAVEIAPGVTSTRGVKWGSPCVKGRGIRTASVGDLFRAEKGNIDTVAAWFRITSDEVLYAVLFEYRRCG